MPYKRNRKGRAHVNAKKVKCDGMTFQSGLERYMYAELKTAGLFEGYENETFTLQEAFIFPDVSVERPIKGSGQYKNRGEKNVRAITYTPDFVGSDYIIECKGRANAQFPIKWKMFKKWLKTNKTGKTLYMPKTKGDVDITIKLILTSRKNKTA